MKTLSSTVDPQYRSDSAVPNTSAHHAGEDVVIYARGPLSHLFTGNHEQTYIPNALRLVGYLTLLLLSA